MLKSVIKNNSIKTHLIICDDESNERCQKMFWREVWDVQVPQFARIGHSGWIGHGCWRVFPAICVDRRVVVHGMTVFEVASEVVRTSIHAIKVISLAGCSTLLNVELFSFPVTLLRQCRNPKIKKVRTRINCRLSALPPPRRHSP
jgi:hypothetical protein